MRKVLLSLSLPLTILTACGEVIDTRTSTVTYQGRPYTVVTETIQTGSETYDVSRVQVRGGSRTCIVDSPGDCEAAIAAGRRHGDR
ncbi:MAG: hypothetical protein AAF636_10045 [Pseudomonadota bacterium]